MRGKQGTADNAVLDLLPKRLATKIKFMSQRDKEPVVSIISKAISYYDQKNTPKASSRLSDETDKLADIAHPADISAFRRVMKAIADRTRGNMTPEAIDARNSEGGKARAKSLTKKQRKEIAIKAAKARWGEKKESD